MNPFCPECLSSKTNLGLPKKPHPNLLLVKKGYWVCKIGHRFKCGRDALDFRIKFPR